jgi:hypothetical protein
MNGEVLIASRGPGIKTLAVVAALLVLAGLVVYAVQHELRARPEPVEKLSAFHDAPRKAFSADEERFAQSLFAVHEQVKNNAVNMMFAGIAFKTGSVDRPGLKARLTPMAAAFANAQTQFSKLSVPASMQSLYQEYAEALRLYKGAADEMLKAAADGADSHLLAAHEMSDKAGSILLKVGEQVWPGEYKPN